MMKQWWAALAGFALGAEILGWAPAGLVAADAPVAPAKTDADDDVFGLTKVWQLHLEIAAKELDKMQPAGGMRFPGLGGAPEPKKAPEKAGEKPPDTHVGSGFGTEFPWAHAALTVAGATYKDVGIRYKGNSTYMMSANMLKRPLQIDFDHFTDGPRFQGLKKLNLGNGAADQSRLREALAFAVFRAAGVPASRTAFAEVTATVPGKHDKEYVGVYVLVEHVGKPFLKDHFKSAKGLLLKPEMISAGGGLAFLGEDWKPYEERYRPRNEASNEQKKRLIDFTRLVNNGSDEQFRKEISSYLDVDEFLRYLAVNALMVNMDSFLSLGHNYFLYLRPDNNKFVIIPWDLDLSFGALMMGGTQDQQLDLSLSHPHTGQNKLIDRLLAMKDVQEQYQKVLKELASTCFTKEKLLKDIAAIDKVTREPLAKEKKAAESRKEAVGGFGFGGMGGLAGQALPLETFIEKRVAAVEAQLAGKSKGVEPAGMGFLGKGGPGGLKGGPGGQGVFGFGQFLAPALLKEIDTNNDKKVSPEELQVWVKQIFKDHDKDGKGIDDKALGAVLGKLMPLPKFDAPGGKGPAGGFDFIGMMGSQLLRGIDPKSDGKLTQEKAQAVFGKLFKDWDKDKNGTLDETELGEGFSQLLLPPGFGAGGAGFPPAAPPMGDKKK